MDLTTAGLGKLRRVDAEQANLLLSDQSESPSIERPMPDSGTADADALGESRSTSGRKRVIDDIAYCNECATLALQLSDTHADGS